MADQMTKPIKAEHKLKEMLEMMLPNIGQPMLIWPYYQLNQLIKSIPDSKKREQMYRLIIEAYHYNDMLMYEQCIGKIQEAIYELK